MADYHNEKKLHPMVKVVISGESPFFGPGAVGLLREIDKCGNVREACKNCGFSYSKGWTLIRRCEEKLGYSIVERQAGGQMGGTARVTDKGRALLDAYEYLEKELREIADDRFCKLMEEYQLTEEA